MTQENLVQVPQALLESFKNYDLPLPPLPKSALRHLRQVENELFATAALPHWLGRGTPNSLSLSDLELRGFFGGRAGAFRATPPGPQPEGLIPENAAAPDEDMETEEEEYFLCGFSGRGLQNRAFLYCYLSPRLRLGITVPFDHAYADPDRERERLAQVMEQLLFVLHCTRAGDNLGVDGPGTLFWVSDWSNSSFQLLNGNKEKILSGDSEEALLDYLEQRRAALSEDNIETRFWIKI